MSQDSSFVGQFDLKSQAGIMSVLSAIRASKISPAEKNELRDLVFAYTNGGGDASVRISLEQKLNAHQITPVVMQRSGKPAPVLSFGTYRPTPNFKAPPATAPTVQDTSAVQSALNAPVFNQPPTNPAPIPQPTPTPTPVPVAPEVVQPVVVQNVTPTPVVPVMPVAQMPPVSVAPVVASAPAPVSAPTLTPAMTVAPTSVPVLAQEPISGTEVNYLERIRQIKTAVNSKVGNPVNLVDINNEVGREYMNALLEAMKKLGSGAVSDMGPAMQRLESAYVDVESAITVHQAKNQKSSEPEVTLVPTVEPTPAFVPPQPPPTPVSAPVSASVPVSTRPVMTEVLLKKEVIEEERSIPTPRVPENDITLVDRPRVAPMPPVRPITPPPIPPIIIDSDSPESVSGFENSSSTDLQSSSLANTPKVLTPQDLPDSASISTGAIGDPLFTKEVDDGLHQLLSDWSLFKKSGLFGTGPKGREHPLYKSISDFQVPLLLAGRFEGATQEIRQSITDYMNGWRYEQGIVYQPGETFDKYLRRVIRHILDLQKKRHQS